MEKIFDFDQISDFLKKDFSLIFDAMNAVTGPYAKSIFVDKMGLAPDCVMNGNPLKDFGGLHPDPNLTYASHLADLLLNKKSYSFGAACDGDGDRNMILGSGCFVNPSDSLAVITANTKCVPGYKDGITGVARSMPTSSAVDNVARALNIPCFETPTGWKFFGNLLDSNLITLCGEESFGTGSNHVREKDGLWAVLYWLQVLAEKKCSVSDLMQKIFDFDQISDFLKKDFSFIFDAMNAVTGPYAKNIFVEKMGLANDCVMNGNPLKDFGGLHPDPNLTYASHLADLLLNKKSYSFGAACDGDGDRNMILGSGCFVNPSDSLAVITANTKCVPGYKDGITGVARSMPTSSAVDNVARALNIPCFETPTGWKFFGNLLDSNLITLCGEESFGTGSNHVREKDGLWAVLYWLQVLAVKKCSVSDLMHNHWKQFGRNYYSRHDYEAIPSNIANQIFGNLTSMLENLKGNSFAGHLVKVADNFSYLDPVDNSISENQGLRLVLDDNSRVIVRLSGTGTKGATLRLYFEKFFDPQQNLSLNPQIALKPLIDDLDALLNISKLTQMETPTVIT